MAVVARFIFDAHERYRRVHGRPLSTVLLMEEAHAFISRARSHSEDESPASSVELCREAFERIAREGRKFGLTHDHIPTTSRTIRDRLIPIQYFLCPPRGE